MDARIGLLDLITAVHERCSKAWETAIARDGGEEYAEWDRNIARELDLESPRGAAAIALKAVQGGHYLEALRLAERACSAERWFLDSFGNIDGHWSPFLEACDLLDRIDNFLATIPAGSQGALLARGCRADVTALVILADWCEEHGFPAAAAEARHLHSLLPRI